MAKRFNSTSLQTAIAVDKDADNSLVVDDAALLHIDKDTGRLLVDTEANLTADLTLIESKMDTANAIATAQAADVVTIKGNSTKVPGFSLPAYDYISCSYTGSNLTGVVYKSGGSSGTTVATLTLTYDGSNNLTSVTKS